MTIPEEVISLMQKRQTRFKPMLLKTPRSEDMRAVAEAQMRSGHGMVIHIDSSSIRAATAMREAVRAAERFNRALNVVTTFTVADQAAEQLRSMQARFEALASLGTLKLD